MKFIRRIFLFFLLASPLLVLAQDHETEEADRQREETEHIQDQPLEHLNEDSVTTDAQVNQAGGRVYVYYGRRYHRPYRYNRRYRRYRSYPYGTYSYRYYFYPYQEPYGYYRRNYP